jgi:putative glutamine amidotransferase
MKFRTALLLIFMFGSSFACSQTCILLSKTYGKGEYEQWLLRQDAGLKLVSLYHVRPDSVAYWLNRAEGFLFTGGEDIYPGRYGQEKDTIDCGEFDLRRDSLEFRMLSCAMERSKPVFGICRGLQLINVHAGGSLVPDIPSSEMGELVLHRNDGPVQHTVKILPGLLKEITRTDSGMVLSNHHQGISQPGRNLIPLAKSADGLTEAIAGTSGVFLIAVQWHPERMNPEHPLSFPLAAAFVQSCRQSAKR